MISHADTTTNLNWLCRSRFVSWARYASIRRKNEENYQFSNNFYVYTYIGFHSETYHLGDTCGFYHSTHARSDIY